MSSPATLAWWRDGEALLGSAVAGLTEAELGAPSRLPGWDRRMLVAHVARNADALGNLLAWARTGVETPMYASPEARVAGIEETAKLPGHELVRDYAEAAARFGVAVDEVPDAAWENEVRTAQGRTVPASQVPWMRCRETWVHVVDLDAGVGFDDLPHQVLSELLRDVIRTWTGRGEAPDLRFVATAEAPRSTDGQVVVGPLPALVAYATGRATPADLARLTGAGLEVPLPRWL